MNKLKRYACCAGVIAGGVVFIAAGIVALGAVNAMAGCFLLMDE